VLTAKVVGMLSVFTFLTVQFYVDGPSGPTPETSAKKAEMASLAQQQRQLADQLATTCESAGRQEAGQSSEQDVMASATAAAANWTLVFDDDPVPAPPAATKVPIRWSDWMFGDVGGRPTDGTVH
jgi:hypothetical protein